MQTKSKDLLFSDKMSYVRVDLKKDKELDRIAAIVLQDSSNARQRIPRQVFTIVSECQKQVLFLQNFLVPRKSKTQKEAEYVSHLRQVLNSPDEDSLMEYETLDGKGRGIKVGTLFRVLSTLFTPST